jgi:RHS repeat-associated protein
VDHLRAVRDIAKDDSGSDMTTVVNHLIYDAFGRVRSESNPAVDSFFLFTARPFDQDSQLQNNLNRWYDARVGRWLSEDPVGFQAEEFNLYRYCANSALLYIDPAGMDWLDCMAECIKDNDPLPYALGAGIKVILLTGGWETKVMVGRMFQALGYTELANDILHYAKMPGTSKLTNIMSTIGTVLSKIGTAQRTAMWHKLGAAASGILGPIEVAYGLSLAAIEVHCTGWCCTAWWYGIPYNHADGNVIDAWKNYYFGK